MNNKKLFFLLPALELAAVLVVSSPAYAQRGRPLDGTYVYLEGRVDPEVASSGPIWIGEQQYGTTGGWFSSDVLKGVNRSLHLQGASVRIQQGCWEDACAGQRQATMNRNRAISVWLVVGLDSTGLYAEAVEFNGPPAESWRATEAVRIALGCSGGPQHSSSSYAYRHRYQWAPPYRYGGGYGYGHGRYSGYGYRTPVILPRPTMPRPPSLHDVIEHAEDVGKTLSPRSQWRDHRKKEKAEKAEKKRREEERRKKKK